MSKYKVLSDQELMSVLGGESDPLNDPRIGTIVTVYYKATADNCSIQALITMAKDEAGQRYYYFDFTDTYYSGWYIYEDLTNTVFETELDIKSKRKTL